MRLRCGVGADEGANINKENYFFFLFFSELNLFFGVEGTSFSFFFFLFLTTHKLIPASCRFTLKHEVVCWCKGKAIPLLVAMEAGAL